MNTALLIIDVQRGLFEFDPQPFEADAVIARINHLSAAARKAGSLVIFIQHERNGSPLQYEGEAWKLASGLTAESSDSYIRKTTPDSFLSTNLQELLLAKNINHVVISGYACEFCVDTTTRRAAALGYSVTLVSDAHTTHDKEHARAEQIRAHENATLPCLTSFGPSISAIPTASVQFAA